MIAATDSLTRLRDIIEPPPVPGWPPAPGVWFLAGFVFVWLVAVLAVVWLRHRRNAYRRQALKELADMDAGLGDPECSTRVSAQLNELLKRTALAAYPRSAVAPLAGSEWLAFLDRSAGLSEFTEGAGRALGSIYSSSTGSPEANELQGLSAAARRWIGTHRAGNPGGE